MNYDLIKEINKRLISTYGLHVCGKPKFKLVWSTDEVEFRNGTFEKYYGEIYLGETTGITECRKYEDADLIDKYILESLEIVSNPELLIQLGYEPLFVFHDKLGNRLPVNWDVIMVFCNYKLNPIRREWRTEEMDRKEEQRILEIEKKKARIKLDDVLPSDEIRKVRLQEVIYNPYSKEANNG